jgi:hypothetical protein
MAYQKYLQKKRKRNKVFGVGSETLKDGKKTGKVGVESSNERMRVMIKETILNIK